MFAAIDMRCKYHEDSCDGKHCHPRSSGTEVVSKAGDAVFRFVYKFPIWGTLYLRLIDEGYFYEFKLFSLSFCSACGAFMGFEPPFEEQVCWRCQDDLGDSEEDGYA